MAWLGSESDSPLLPRAGTPSLEQLVPSPINFIVSQFYSRRLSLSLSWKWLCGRRCRLRLVFCECAVRFFVDLGVFAAVEELVSLQYLGV